MLARISQSHVGGIQVTRARSRVLRFIALPASRPGRMSRIVHLLSLIPSAAAYVRSAMKHQQLCSLTKANAGESGEEGWS